MADNIQDSINQADFQKNIDVSSIVTSLAIGIAEAQERLDDNSIRQISRLTEIEVAGKSLLELGFQPAFYAFEYADISASIQLKMAIKKSLSVDLSLAADFSNNITFDKDFFKSFEKTKDKSISKYSAKDKRVALEASTKKSVSVNQKTFDIHTEQGSFSKIESAKEKMRDSTENIRADHVIDQKKELVVQSAADAYISTENGFIIVTIPKSSAGKTIGILKMESDYTGPAVTMNLSNSDTFAKDNNFTDTITDAVIKNGNTGVVKGLHNNQLYRDESTKISLEVYFDWDKESIDFTYSRGIQSDAVEYEDMELLALLLEKDPNLKITLKGYTDGSGTNTQSNSDYNDGLSKRRNQSVINCLQRIAGWKINDTQFVPQPFGEELAKNDSNPSAEVAAYRKVVIEVDLSHDYLFFEGGKIDSDAQTPTQGPPDEFVFLNTIAQVPDGTIQFEWGGDLKQLNISNEQITEFASQSAGTFDVFYYERVNESYYLLDQSTIINYFVHSTEDKEIDIKIDNEASADFNKNKTKVYVSETDNEKERLRNVSNQIEGDRSLALSGSLDVRHSRQFGVSMEGNAAISARMIAVPPPSGLEQYLSSLINNNS